MVVCVYKKPKFYIFVYVIFCWVIIGKSFVFC